MKVLIISFFSLLNFCSTYGQVPETAIAKVQYTFIHMRDTTKPDKLYQENMLLILGKNASRYLSLDGITEKNKRDKELQNQMSESPGAKIKTGSIKLPKKDEYFYFTKENTLIIQQQFLNTYLIEETKYNINWSISNDTMSFEGIHCQKAMAYFKGRNWIAWYATELPFQSGPWKLNGLPGLIIDAHDEKDQVHFQFAGMEMIKKTKNKKIAKADTKEKVGELPIVLDMQNENSLEFNLIQLPENAIKTSRIDFTKIQEAIRKDPKGFISAQMAGSPSSIKILSGSRIVNANVSPEIVFNNPIELPEK